MRAKYVVCTNFSTKKLRVFCRNNKQKERGTKMTLGIHNAGKHGKSQKKPKAKEEKKELPPVFPKIEYPKEIQLLDELNKANKEKYKKWLYKKMVTEKILGKSTLIIGVRGKDGIVLGGDTKAMSGGETSFEKKVRTFTVQNAPIIFAGAGVVGIIDDFIEKFEETLTASIQEGKISSLLSIKVIGEDMVEKFEERYGPKLGKPPLHFILGGLSELKRGQARIYEIGPGGVGQKIKYASLVGHGTPLLEQLQNISFRKIPRKG